jgi:hypothetical protein
MEHADFTTRIEHLQASRAFLLIAGSTLGVLWLLALIMVLIKSQGLGTFSLTMTLFLTALSTCLLFIGAALAQTKIEFYRALRDLCREMREHRAEGPPPTPAA